MVDLMGFVLWPCYVDNHVNNVHNLLLTLINTDITPFVHCFCVDKFVYHKVINILNSLYILIIYCYISNGVIILYLTNN